MLKHNRCVNMQNRNERQLWAKQALLPDGWADNVLVVVDGAGRIASVTPGSPSQGQVVSTLLPAPVNLHSHAFQRAMAGLTERRGPDPRDSFWTWRQLMYRFLDHLTPDDVRAITALVQMEMLEAGFGASVEFHYLHHRPGGHPYDDIAEMAHTVCAAAADTGIGLTLLPVLYRYGGCDMRPLGPGQIRFGNDRDSFARLVTGAAASVAKLPADCTTGIAPHSLRAVQPGDLVFCHDMAGDGVIHMHLAEQLDEVDEVRAAYGARPTEWLLNNAAVNDRWCLIHCTQMTPAETVALARTGAVAGLCPITESSLGDGIFDGARFMVHGGRFGVGSDSNIRISLIEELRGLEYSQRLRDQARAVLARPAQSTGHVLWQGAAMGGAQAAGRASGEIRPGLLADLVGIDHSSPDLDVRWGDLTLDTLIFAGDRGAISDVWSAGRHMVRGGAHIRRTEIVAGYRAAMRRLRDVI